MVLSNHCGVPLTFASSGGLLLLLLLLLSICWGSSQARKHPHWYCRISKPASQSQLPCHVQIVATSHQPSSLPGTHHSSLSAAFLGNPTLDCILTQPSWRPTVCLPHPPPPRPACAHVCRLSRQSTSPTLSSPTTLTTGPCWPKGACCTADCGRAQSHTLTQRVTHAPCTGAQPQDACGFRV
jgi:hypothetical protein